MSADLFKLDGPLFEDEAPEIKRVETRLRNYESKVGNAPYNIDEIVEKVRDRLREDFERHGYGYLLGDAKKKSFREGFDAQKSNQKTDEDGDVILNYGKHSDKKQNVFKEPPLKESPKEQRKKPPYSNQDKKEVISQENVKNEMPGARFQVLKQSTLSYAEDDVAKEIGQITETTKGTLNSAKVRMWKNHCALFNSLPSQWVNYFDREYKVKDCFRKRTYLQERRRYY